MLEKLQDRKLTEGEITSVSDVRIIRDGAIIYTGKVGSLFREKNQVKQVGTGQECGITVKDYVDFQKNDTIEAFSVTSTESQFNGGQNRKTSIAKTIKSR